MRSGSKGRGASFNTPNRFEALHREVLPPELHTDPAADWAAGEEERHPGIPTRYYADASRSILVRNDSPVQGMRTRMHLLLCPPLA